MLAQHPRRRPGRPNEDGFTLIELLVTVAIIGIITALAIPTLLNSLERGRQAATLALIRAIGDALQVYSNDNEVYPIVADTVTLLPLLQPYADNLDHRDEWGFPLHYESDGENYTIESYGRNGADDDPNLTPETRYVFELDILYSNGFLLNGPE